MGEEDSLHTRFAQALATFRRSIVDLDSLAVELEGVKETFRRNATATRAAPPMRR